MQEAPRPFQVSTLCECQYLPEERDITSGKDRLCPEPEQEEGLDRFHLHRHELVRGRDSPDLWETLGY